MARAHTAFFEQVAAAAPSREQTVARLDALSKLLDTAFVVPGTNIRFGVDGVIRLVPGIGDFVATLLSSYLIWEARRLGLPRWKVLRMVANVAFEGVVGLVPVAGDAFDILFRANRRNMRILREHLDGEDRHQRGVVDADYRVVERAR